MTRLSLIAAAVAAAFAATVCKPESGRRADRAAKEVVEQRDDLLDVVEQDQPDEVLAEAGKLAKVAHQFEVQKSRRLAALQTSYDLCVTQRGLIAVLARDMQITDAARGKLNEKLTRLQTRLDETANLLEGLATVNIDAWEERNSAVTDAMKRLDDSREDTWESLEDAPHIDPNAS
jgi:hypothetical protein